ncbi:MAG: pyruvate kinase [Lachnospiraceae bacterium]|jgi:pyruvate kinase
MRKTKIICTIGPACDDEAMLKEMCLAGMNVARLNFSHGTHQWHLKVINSIKKLRSELNLPIAIMLDTKGPECRIGRFEEGKVYLNEGDEFTFTTEDVVGGQDRVGVSYEGLAEDMACGDTIFLNNGLVELQVQKTEESEVICKVMSGGEVSDRKSMSFPGKMLKQVYLSEADKADMLFGIENQVDFIACSFVSSRRDLIDVRTFLDANGGEDIDLIAKIENRTGVDSVDEIVLECDGIMVARGDLGVEIPFAEIPAIQKKLITKCRLLGRRVIVATEMLESMIINPRPTRAETSDVANAVYDGTSAVMLSAESASGKYPVEAVKTMAAIAEETEKNIDYLGMYKSSRFEIQNHLDAISHATCGMAIDIGARCIVACTNSGLTARMVSRFRSPTDIIGMTSNKRALYKLALSWGVIPVLSEQFDSTDVLFYHARNAAQGLIEMNEGDYIVITGGRIDGRSGNTNLIKVERF